MTTLIILLALIGSMILAFPRKKHPHTWKKKYIQEHKNNAEPANYKVIAKLVLINNIKSTRYTVLEKTSGLDWKQSPLAKEYVTYYQAEEKMYELACKDEEKAMREEYDKILSET